MIAIDDALAAALEQIDADSWEELSGAVPPEIAQTLKLTVERHGNIVCTRCLASDAPLNNRAIAVGLGGPGNECTRELIFSLKEQYVACGLKNFALQISPHARPAELPLWLAEAGLVVRGHWVKLVRGQAPVAPVRTDLEVRQVAAGDAQLFGDVSARGFGRPPIAAYWMGSTVGFPRWRNYLAYDRDQPAGAAAMYIDGEYAWLGIGSTLPEYRQRGTQAALIARRISDGLELGVRYFISETESVNTSSHNLMRAGFEHAYDRPNYGITQEAAVS